MILYHGTNKISLIIELIPQEIVEQIVNDKNKEYDIAMNDFYSSEVYAKLLDEETGLYLESAAYIYELYKDEKKYGKLVQLEI